MKKKILKKMTTGTLDSYCNQKFWWLNVDVARKQQYSCCAATPADIDIPWLAKNPGKLFNTPLLHAERQAMLDNQHVASCQDNCYGPESQGLISRRQLEQGNKKTHTDISAEPSLVNIVLGSTCNLTCVYCCKQYSSAWLQDIKDHGTYFDTDRFRIYPNDRFRKHFQIQSHPDYKLLIDELAKLPADIVHISGGEPFLYANLYDLVCACKAKTIKINTGLGVDSKRFKQQLEQLRALTNVEILISGETLHDLYELVRFGNTWHRFATNLDLVQQLGFKHTMVNVISNLTVLGMVDYYRKYQQSQFYFLLCNDPDFLSVNVLDDESKTKVVAALELTDHPAKKTILDNIGRPATATQRQDFSRYIREFASRRNISLDVLPKSLRHWIQNV